MRSGGLLLRIPPALSRRPGRGVGRAAPLSLAAVLVASLAALPVAASPAPPGIPPDHAVSPAALPPPPGRTTLESRRPNGGFPNNRSVDPAISANGRYVAFTSWATNIAGAAAGLPVPVPAVYVRDRRTDKTVRVPLPPQFGGGQAAEPAISADGNVVAYTYQPPPGLIAQGSYVVAWDRKAGTTRIVSRTEKGTPADRSRQPSVSDDGRFIAYASDNPAIVNPDLNETDTDVFRYDRRTQKTILVSVSWTGESAFGDSSQPAISGDGTQVAFSSDAGDSLLDEDTGNGLQVYLRDIPAKRTERISVPPDGGPANGIAGAPSISADGRYVAFEAEATNLVAGDDDRAADVFRRDRRRGETILVSVTPGGAPGNAVSGQPAITRDGRMVAFASSATDLLAAPTGAVAGRLAAVANLRDAEVYERDLATGETIMISVSLSGGPGGRRSLAPAVAGNGRFVAWMSTSDVLVKGDNGGFADVFLRDLPPAPALNPPVLDYGSGAVGSPPVPMAAVLSNAGWSPLTAGKAKVTGAGKADFKIVADGCNERVLRRGEACTVSIAFAATKAGQRAATLQVPDDAAGSPRTAALRGRGSKAVLKVDPEVGRPGIVVIATGEGFPPGAQVRLSWSEGITPSMPVVVADGEGRFRVPVLVFHNDVIGRRELVAEPNGAGGFPTATAPMLVSEPPVEPPGFLFVIRRLIDLPILLLLRG